MPLRATILAAVCALFVATPTNADAQGATGVIRGEVIDASGGRLPDVTVIATTADGRVPATTTTTDATGGYVFRAMPPGPAMLRFRRDGFAGVAGLVVTQYVGNAVSDALARGSLAHRGTMSGWSSRIANASAIAPFSTTKLPSM